jgi:hypothetical protein
MKHFINVEGYSDIVREESSQAIINTDTEQYRLMIKRRELMRNQKEEIQTLKNEVTEIKILLQNMVEKLHG